MDAINTEAIIGAAIALTAAVVGVVQWVRQRGKADGRKEGEAHTERMLIETKIDALIESNKRLAQMLREDLELDGDVKAEVDKILQIDSELMDVLKHPNDTDFGVKPVLEKLDTLMNEVRELRSQLERDR